MYIGIDLGGTNIAVGLVDENYKIIAKDSAPTMAKRGYVEIVKDMAELCKKILNDNNVSLDELKGVGIGCPGTVDSKEGVVIFSNNIRMENTPLVEEFKKHIDTKVSIINDADAAAYGEYKVNGNGVDSFVFITLGTGVGGGVIINGKIYNGFNYAGGELGHITLVHDGIPCNCGNIGCWEAYASVTALINQTEEAMKRNPQSLMHKVAAEEGKISGKTAFVAAKAGDRVGTKVVEKYLEYVGSGLVSIVNIFQPEKLVIGGGISKEGDYLLNPIKEYCYGHEYNKSRKKTEITIAKLFNDAGIIGAALASEAR